MTCIISILDFIEKLFAFWIFSIYDILFFYGWTSFIVISILLISFCAVFTSRKKRDMQELEYASGSSRYDFE